MTLTALTNNFATMLDQWHERDDNGINFFNRHVTVRFGHALTLPLRILTAPIDIAIGYVSIPLTLLTLFRDRNIYCFTTKQLEAQRLFLPGLFKSVISTLNPYFLRNAVSSDSNEMDGFITQFFRKKMKNEIQDLIDQESFFEKHIFSRSLVLCEMIAVIIARIADVAIGVIGGAGAILGTLFICPFASIETIRKIKHLADNSFMALQFLGVIGDLYGTFARFVNPWIEQKRRIRYQY